MADEMYLDNLDELVNDENKVVTFKWLSTNLKVHVNQAKQMLYAFVQQERNKKDNEKINVTYFVSGIPKSENGSLGHKCMVVPEEELAAFKSTFSTLTSCHIYSVQKVKLKDSCALYIADYDNTKDKILKSCKYSAIKYEKAKARSKDELAKLGALLPIQAAEPSKVQSQSLSKTGANGTSSSKVKHEPKGSIANMFAAGAKKKDTEHSTDASSKEKEKPKQVKGGKGGGVMSFFSKQTEKPSKPVESKPDIKETSKPEPKTQKKEETQVKKQESKKARQSKGKKSTRKSDSDDDKPDKKRRKRIRDDMFESSSEDEMEILEESPVPSPVREPSPEPEPESPIAKKQSKVDSDEETEKTHKSNGGQKRRKRTRKLVPKTFMDDDGFMVTEKVWESDSTDASEREEEPKKAPSPVKQSKTQTAKKTSPHKKSPPKGPKNQTSLTSFFKKK